MHASGHRALDDRKAIFDLIEAHPLVALVCHRDEAQTMAGLVATALGVRS